MRVVGIGLLVIAGWAFAFEVLVRLGLNELGASVAIIIISLWMIDRQNYRWRQKG